MIDIKLPTFLLLYSSIGMKMIVVDDFRIYYCHTDTSTIELAPNFHPRSESVVNSTA